MPQDRHLSPLEIAQMPGPYGDIGSQPPGPPDRPLSSDEMERLDLSTQPKPIVPPVTPPSPLTPPTPPPSKPWYSQLYDTLGGGRGIAGAVARGAGGILSASGGISGGLKAGIGEMAAQQIEGSGGGRGEGGYHPSLNESPLSAMYHGFDVGQNEGMDALKRTGVQAGLGMIPFRSIVKPGEALLSMLRGGGLAAGGGALSQLAQGQTPTLGSAAINAGVGAATAGIGSRFLGRPNEGLVSKTPYGPEPAPPIAPNMIQQEVREARQQALLAAGKARNPAHASMLVDAEDAKLQDQFDTANVFRDLEVGKTTNEANIAQQQAIDMKAKEATASNVAQQQATDMISKEGRAANVAQQGVVDAATKNAQKQKNIELMGGIGAQEDANKAATLATKSATGEQLRDQNNLTDVMNWRAKNRASTLSDLQDSFDTAISQSDTRLAAEKLEEARRGLVPGVPRISDSYQAPIPGGTRRGSQPYVPSGDEDVPTPFIPPGGRPPTPGSPIDPTSPTPPTPSGAPPADIGPFGRIITIGSDVTPAYQGNVRRAANSLPYTPLAPRRLRAGGIFNMGPSSLGPPPDIPGTGGADIPTPAHDPSSMSLEGPPIPTEGPLPPSMPPIRRIIHTPNEPVESFQPGDQIHVHSDYHGEGSGRVMGVDPDFANLVHVQMDDGSAAAYPSTMIRHYPPEHEMVSPLPSEPLPPSRPPNVPYSDEVTQFMDNLNNELGLFNKPGSLPRDKSGAVTVAHQTGIPGPTTDYRINPDTGYVWKPDEVYNHPNAVAMRARLQAVRDAFSLKPKVWANQPIPPPPPTLGPQIPGEGGGDIPSPAHSPLSMFLHVPGSEAPPTVPTPPPPVGPPVAPPVPPPPPPPPVIPPPRSASPIEPPTIPVDQPGTPRPGQTQSQADREASFAARQARAIPPPTTPVGEGRPGGKVFPGDEYPEFRAAMDDLNNRYRLAEPGPEKRALGGQVAELRNFLSGKGAQAFTPEEAAARIAMGGTPAPPITPPVPPVTPPAPAPDLTMRGTPKVSGVDQTAKMRAAALAARAAKKAATAEALSQSGAQVDKASAIQAEMDANPATNATPDTRPAPTRKALDALAKFLKGEEGSAGPPEKGAIAPGLMRLMMTGTGAALGAGVGGAMSDDPLSGAGYGALTGGTLGYAVSGAGNPETTLAELQAARRAATTPDAQAAISSAIQGHLSNVGQAAPSKIGDAVQELINWRNAGYLSPTSGLAIPKKTLADFGGYQNAIARKLMSNAPTLAERQADRGVGMNAFKEQFRVPTNVNNYVQGMIHPELAQGSVGMTLPRQAGGALGVITRPFSAAQHMVAQAYGRSGFTPEEIQKNLFLNTPETVAGKTYYGMQKSPLWRFLDPFAKIKTNLAESGLQHMPGIGLLPSLKGNPNDKWARQILGTGYMAAGAAKGMQDQSDYEAGGSPIPISTIGLLGATAAQGGLPTALGYGLTRGGRAAYNMMPGIGAALPPPGPNESTEDYLTKRAKEQLQQTVYSWMMPQTPSSTVR